MNTEKLSVCVYACVCVFSSMYMCVHEQLLGVSIVVVHSINN